MTAGFKHVGFLTKRDDMTFAQFTEHWVQVHSELAKSVPGVRAYTVNPIDRAVYPDSPADGFSEVWFDSLEAAEIGWASPAGLATFADVDNFVKSLVVTNLTESVIVPKQ